MEVQSKHWNCIVEPQKYMRRRLKNVSTRNTTHYFSLIHFHLFIVKSQGDKNAGKLKMTKDPLFEKCVDQV